MPYQLPAPSTLEDVFKMNPAAFSQAQQFMGGGVRQNEQDLQESQLQNMFNQQNNPQRVQAQQMQNEQMGAQLPGMFADSATKVRNNSNAAALNEETLKAARTKFAAAATQAHLDELEAKGQEMMYSSDPAVAADGHRIVMAHRDIVRDRAKQEEMAKRETTRMRTQGDETRKTNRELIEAGKFAPKGSGKGSGDPFQEAMSEGDPVKRHQKLQGAYILALENGDEEAPLLKRLMEASEPAARAKLQAGGAPVYSIDPAKGIVQTTRADAVPPLSVPQQSHTDAAKEQAMADLASGAQFSSPEVESQVRKFAGSGAKQAAKKPVTEAEYNALPPGSTYLHPDGRMKVKK